MPRKRISQGAAIRPKAPPRRKAAVRTTSRRQGGAASRSANRPTRRAQRGRPY